MCFRAIFIVLPNFMRKSIVGVVILVQLLNENITRQCNCRACGCTFSYITNLLPVLWKIYFTLSHLKATAIPLLLFQSLHFFTRTNTWCTAIPSYHLNCATTNNHTFTVGPGAFRVGGWGGGVVGGDIWRINQKKIHFSKKWNLMVSITGEACILKLLVMKF